MSMQSVCLMMQFTEIHIKKLWDYLCSSGSFLSWLTLFAYITLKQKQKKVLLSYYMLASSNYRYIKIINKS